MSIMRSFSFGLLVLSCVPCIAQSGPGTTFTMQQKTAVPGATLQSGDYTIQIVDHLNDRSVVQITSQSKGSTVTFLGVGATSTSFSSVTGPVVWNKSAHGERSLRGFTFPAGERLEFVYPKNDAVALANANNEGVVAVDPASENRPELSKLSPSDLQLVTLWSLTPVTIGPESASTKGIEAKRFIAAANQGNQVTASSTPATPSAAALSPSTISVTVTPHRAPTRSALVAKLEKPRLAANADGGGSYVKRLPQTAGYTPLVGILAVFSLCGALCMRVRSTM